jgi:thioredoxin-related protein
LAPQSLRKRAAFPNRHLLRHVHIRFSCSPADGGCGKIGTAAAATSVDTDEQARQDYSSGARSVRAMRESVRVGMLLLVLAAAAPAFGEPIEWSHDVDAAWQRTVREGRPLLLFITRSRCKYCAQMKTATLVDVQVADQVMTGFVPVAIDPQSDPELIKELNVRSFPTTLIISPDALMLDQIKGYLPPADFQKRLTRCRASSAVHRPRSSRR